MKPSTMKRSAITGAIAIVVIAISWMIGFRGGLSHADGQRDCADCHDDQRLGWRAE